MELAAKINEYVTENKIPKKKLAERAHISMNALSLSLSGKRKLLADEYIRICDALCVPYTRFAEAHDQAS